MTTAPNPTIEARVERLHAHGMVDMHFDMLMDLYDNSANWLSIPGSVERLSHVKHRNRAYVPGETVRKPCFQVHKERPHAFHDLDQGRQKL